MKVDASLADKLIAATDVSGMHAACREISESMGFEHFIYGLRIPISLSQPFHFCLSGFPSEWRSRYDAMGYLKIDPIVAAAFSSMLPVCWDEVTDIPPTAKTMFREAAEYGLCHGISSPIIGRNGEIGMLSLARREPIPTGAGERYELKACINWFSTVLHEAVHNMLLASKKPPLPKDSLTAREKDCLMWVADGKTTSEIAALLKITERTVLFHIENAGRKLGVSGRHNIIARAIALGEIELNHHVLSAVRALPAVHETLH